MLAEKIKMRYFMCGCFATRPERVLLAFDVRESGLQNQKASRHTFRFSILIMNRFLVNVDKIEMR
jgi:hypothetical protein